MSNFPASVPSDRRPIKARSTWWAPAISRRLARLGVRPNQVSVASVIFALIAAAALMYEAAGSRSSIPYFIAAACIQLRLLANLLDGLIAVEGNQQTAIGELYNEIPDRIADVALLAAAGYASLHGEWGIAFGWIASVLAVTTAYLRALGARRGNPQDFCGPQAKQHRMFVLSVACILAALERWAGLAPRILFILLIVIALGTLLTCVRRTLRLARHLGPT